MPHYQTWEEFSRAAEKLYLSDPMKVRVVLKYRHCDGNLCIKVTDDVVSIFRKQPARCFWNSQIKALSCNKHQN
nr:signal recognition particle 9 kDa protein isoform X4 [Pogona vitticeps]